MNQLVIFDLDGVIIDSEHLYNQRFSEFASSCGIWMPIEEIERFVGTSHGFWERISELNPLHDIVKTETEYSRFKVANPIHYRSIYRSYTTDLLNQIKKAGYYTALASSSPSHVIKDVLCQCDILDKFDLILSGKDLPVSKPDPMIFSLCAQKLGVSPRYSVVIEDSESGILAGMRAGMKVIGIKDPHFKFDYSQADLTVDNIEEIDIVRINELLKF